MRSAVPLNARNILKRVENADENSAERNEADVFGSVYRQSRKPRRKLMSVENVNDKKADSKNTNPSVPAREKRVSGEKGSACLGCFLRCEKFHGIDVVFFSLNSGGCFNGRSGGGGLCLALFPIRIFRK